jgi:hypothetical protein
VLCIAWKDRDVPRIDTRSGTRRPKDAPAWKLAWAAHTYNDPEASHAQLRDAVEATLEILLRYWYPGQLGNLDRILATHEISPAIARRYATTLLSRLPDVGEASAADWISHARKRIVDHAKPLDAAPKPNYRLGKGSKAAAAKDATIAAAAGLEAPISQAVAPETTVPVTSTTIHKAKGSEADAVLIVIPAPASVEELLAHWTGKSTQDSAVLRVYYVALTRARRLVGLTYPFTAHKQIMKHLDDHAISYRVAPACEPKAMGSRKKSGTPTPGTETIPGSC